MITGAVTAASLNGGTLDVNYDATTELRLAAGVAYDVYQRDSMTGEETAKNYWLGAKIQVNQEHVGIAADRKQCQ